MTDKPDRVDQFEADIAASPVALGRLLDAWRQPDLGGRSRFAFTGLGSSRYAASIVATCLRSAGANAWVDIASSAKTASSAPADDLVFVAISASGRTREVRDAAEHHRGRSLVVAVTNDPVSPLAAMADLVVPLQAGEETGGIACRTFRATIAALALLTGLATPDALRPSADALAARLEAIDAGALAPMLDALDAAPSIDVLADGPLLGLAEQAALMLREAPRLAAHAYDTADWLHTGVYLAFPRHRALLFTGSAADAEVIDTIRRRGGDVVTIAPETADAGPIARALVESVVAERLAAALWRRATATATATG